MRLHPPSQGIGPLALYRGPPLAAALDAPWAAAPRERIRRKLPRWLDGVARTRPSSDVDHLRARLTGVDPALAPNLIRPMA